MKYTVDSTVFDLSPDIQFGILVGKDLKNSVTTTEDEQRLRDAEALMRRRY